MTLTRTVINARPFRPVAALTLLAAVTAQAFAQSWNYDSTRNDGSGGERQTRRGDAWVSGRTDPGLTPVK